MCKHNLAALGDVQVSRADVAPIRDSMLVLPDWMQVSLTQLTGKPYTGQPATRNSAVNHLIAALAATVLGTALSVAVVGASTPLALLLLPWGWATTLHGLRKLRLTIVHQASHHNVTRNKRLDYALGEALTIVLLTQNFTDYREEHLSPHHGRAHMTPDDPTVQGVLLVTTQPSPQTPLPSCPDNNEEGLFAACLPLS